MEVEKLSKRGNLKKGEVNFERGGSDHLRNYAPNY